MSERGSFTSEYFYNSHDYEIIRKALDKNDKYLCIASPAKWGDYEMPIVQGKVGELSSNCEPLTLYTALSGVKTDEEVRFVVMCDAGSIELVKKSPEGEIDIIHLEEGWVWG